MGRLAISFQSDKSISRYRELASLVARYPFHAISVYQDLFYQPPWPALFQFAEHTREPLVGPAVVNPYLTHPVLIAGHLAMLDAVSHGRAYLGVGRGAFFDAIGMTQPRPLRAIRECVQLVQRLLQGKRDTFEGEVFHATKDAYLRFPVPGRKLPVLIGGWGPRTLALGGEIADMVKVGGCANPDSAPWFRDHLDAGSLRAGRAKGATALVYGAVTVVDRDRARAEAVARREVAMYVAVAGKLDPTYSPPSGEIEAVESALAAGDAEMAGRALSRDTLARFCVHGTPDDIIDHVERMFASGVDVFELGTPHGIDEVAAIRMLGEEVLPRFSD